MSDRSTSLQEVINAAVENGRRSLYTCAPARVVKWEPSSQRANCQILVQHVTPEDEEGNRVVASWPVVTGVPVQFPGAGGYRLTVPVSDGSGGTDATTGLLIWSHLSLDKWLTGNGREVDPEFDHDHALNDAIFVPGLMPFGAPWQSMPTDSASFGSDSDGNGRVHCKTSEVLLGDGATKEVARKGDAVIAAATMTTWISKVTTVAAAIDPTIVAPTDFGTINEGSAHIKAVD